MPDNNPEHISSPDHDSRYFPRWEVDGPVECQLDGDIEIREGKTKDISCAGARIVGDWHIAPRQKIKLTIHLSRKTKITLNGHILWVRSNNNQQEMGVTFYNTPDDIQDTILQYAFEVDRSQVVNQWFKGWNKS